MQDELSMYLSAQYAKDSGDFEPSKIELDVDTMLEKIPSTEGYESKVKISKGKLFYIGDDDSKDYN